MEPETLAPQPGPEQNPAQYRPDIGSNIESGPVLPTPERGGLETGAERREQQPAAPTTPTPTAVPMILPAPVLADEPVADATTVSDTPIVANDDDLIEKEWVEKAKKIVAETRDDPYRREAAVNQLQRDYLMKRYGRELGAA